MEVEQQEIKAVWGEELAIVSDSTTEFLYAPLPKAELIALCIAREVVMYVIVGSWKPSG